MAPKFCVHELGWLELDIDLLLYGETGLVDKELSFSLQAKATLWLYNSLMVFYYGVCVVQYVLCGIFLKCNLLL